MRKIIFITLFLSVFQVSGYSQNTKFSEQVNNTIELGYDSIVKIATIKINNKTFNKDNFSLIKILTDSKQVIVSFSNPIDYTTENSCAYISVDVTLFQLDFGLYFTTSKSQMGNPQRKCKFSNTNIPFFKKSDETENNIQFVLSSIKKSNEITLSKSRRERTSL